MPFGEGGRVGAVVVGDYFAKMFLMHDGVSEERY